MRDPSWFDDVKSPSEKNDPHIRIPAGFPGPGWGKLGSKNSLNVMAFAGHLMRCVPAVFWQTEVNMKSFSIHNETDGFTGFPG